MNALQTWYAQYTAPPGTRHVDVLDGVRALCVLLVAWYHFWQQSWLTPVLRLPGHTVSLDFLLRSGYIWVDALLLLSGFLLFLPYARRAQAQRALPATRAFYRRRALRIVPSYYLNVLVMLLFVALPQGSYQTAGAMAKDLAAHATFTHTLFRESYLFTPLNGALWTLGVEAQFYLLCPLLARAFLKRPAVTWGCMTAAAFAFRAYAAGTGDSVLLVNQLPAFLDVYANGFAAASVYVSLAKNLRANGKTRLLFTVIAAMAAALIVPLLKAQAGASGAEGIRVSQMQNRFAFSAYMAVFMIAAAFSCGGLRALLGNRVMRFFSAVSFQYYIWHQVLAVQLKRWGIPPAVSETPNIAGEQPWQTQYTVCCFLCALALATLTTYCFERPVIRLFDRIRRRKRPCETHE